MHIRQLLHQVLNGMEFCVTGMPTGLLTLDERTSGLHPGIVIIASRPFMGKTALAIDIANHAALNLTRKVSYFTFNESEVRIASRFLYQGAGIPFWKNRESINDEDRANLESTSHAMNATKISIIAGSKLSQEDICKYIHTYHDCDEPGLVVIDDIQSLVKATARKHDPTASDFSSTLAALERLAEEIGVPILILSDLPRSIEKRKDRRPVFRDLEKAGLLKFHANLVIFLFREGFYDPDIGDSGKIECMVGKNSNGGIGTVFLEFCQNSGRFLDCQCA